jgi:hypothetical protein
MARGVRVVLSKEMDKIYFDLVISELKKIEVQNVIDIKFGITPAHTINKSFIPSRDFINLLSNQSILISSLISSESTSKN